MIDVDRVSLNILEADPESPAAGDLFCSTPNGFGPKATQSASGFMRKEDKLKLDNMSANGSGDDWISGLLIEAQPSPNQTVKYGLGTYMINGIVYSIAAGGNYDLTNGYGGVNHYTALSASQRAIVLIYVDTAQVIKSVAGTATSDSDPPLPSIPSDVVSLAFVTIRKHSNGNAKNINPSDITDVRLPRKPKSDELSKVSVNDTTSGFLKDKLSDNGNVHFTKENADSNETLKADVQFGTSATTACVGNDSRLSDNRTDGNAIHKATSGEIAAMTEKGTPVSADLIVIEDSADSNNKKKVQIGNLPGGSGTDANAIHKNAASEISTITEKTTPVAGDLLIIEDSADSNNKKKVQASNLMKVGGSLSAIQIRRTTTYSITGSFADVTFDTVDLSNDTATLEQDGTYPERINIKKSGLYLIAVYGRYHQTSSQTLYPQVKKNGSTVLTPSTETIQSNCGTSDAIALCRPNLVSLTANDYITFQIKAGSTGNTISTGLLFQVIKLDSLTGCVYPGADTDAIHKTTASEISALTAKATPVGNDMLLIEDSAASNSKKKILISSLPGLASSEATATGSTTTTSVTDVQMNSMTLTPGAGTYLAMFSTSVSHSSTAATIDVSLYANSAQVAASSRQYKSGSGAQSGGLVAPLATQAVITVGASQVIEVKWKTSGSTATAYQRSLTLVKIA